MNGLDEHALGAPIPPHEPEAEDPTPVHTRYSAAPKPAHPVGEPRIVHSLLLAAWLGKLVDVLPHGERKG